MAIVKVTVHLDSMENINRDLVHDPGHELEQRERIDGFSSHILGESGMEIHLVGVHDPGHKLQQRAHTGRRLEVAVGAIAAVHRRAIGRRLRGCWQRRAIGLAALRRRLLRDLHGHTHVRIASSTPMGSLVLPAAFDLAAS